MKANVNYIYLLLMAFLFVQCRTYSFDNINKAIVNNLGNHDSEIVEDSMLIKLANIGLKRNYDWKWGVRVIDSVKEGYSYVTEYYPDDITFRGVAIDSNRALVWEGKQSGRTFTKAAFQQPGYFAHVIFYNKKGKRTKEYNYSLIW